MRDIVKKYGRHFLQAGRAHKKLLFILLASVLIFMIALTWLRHGTGVALTEDAFCGTEAHQHTDDCFTKVLLCEETEEETQTQLPGHQHTESCYAYQEIVLCGLEESPGHQHSDECYESIVADRISEEPGYIETELPAAEEVLVCELEETEGHSHTESCFGTEKKLICGLEETFPENDAPAHVHTDECYEKILNCGLEEHSHVLQCFSDRTADLESASDWEATLPQLCGIWAEDVVAVASSQLGYQESSQNYLVVNDSQDIVSDTENTAMKKGYTRYGAWYGDPYGDWCAMFASFCLHYAGVPESKMPLAAEASGWAASLTEYGLYKNSADAQPLPGDLVFFSMADPSRGKIDHVGIVTDTEYGYDGNGLYRVCALRVIEGNSADAVRENSYDGSDSRILGYGSLPEQALLAEILGIGETEEETEAVTEAETEEETEEETEVVTEEETEEETDRETEAVLSAPRALATADGPYEDFVEENEQTTDHITIRIHWVDGSDLDRVRPTSVSFRLISRTFYKEQNASGSLKQDGSGLFYDPEEDVTVESVELRQTEDLSGRDENLWQHDFEFDEPLSFNVVREEKYGASFYETEITKTGNCEYTVTNTLRTGDVIVTSTGQGSTDNRTLDRNYRKGHYYHVDVRVDATYTYVYYGDELVLVNGTDLYVTKNWVTADSSRIPDSVTFNVVKDNGDGSTTALYWDENGLQTVKPTGRPVSLTIRKNADGSWSTASVSLEGGSYALEELSPDGFVSEITYVTIDENAGDKDTGSYYVHEGTVSVDAVNWVMYELNDNHDSSYVYYQNGKYADYAYGRLDGSLYTDPHEAQSNNGEDYEFFLDNRNTVGGRGLYYLTDQSSIWVNLDYSYTYTDENGQTVKNSVYGYSFEFTPEQWMAENLCLSKDHSDSQAGVDLLIDGDTLMGLILEASTRTEIDCSAVNTAEGARTVYLRGEKSWYDADGRLEIGHDNAAEMTLLVYRSADQGKSWEALREGTDYVVQWVDDVYYIYGSGGGGVYIGLLESDDENSYLYRVEEVPVQGYSPGTHTTANAQGGSLFETSWNFTNSGVNDSTLTIRKITEDGEELCDAFFTLFQSYVPEAGAKTQEAWYDGSEWIEVSGNEGEIPSFPIGSVTVSPLHDGDYFLTETMAPDGYCRLSSPVSFTVQGGKISLKEAPPEVHMDEDGMTLYVVNLAGSMLPETGGGGFRPFTAAGLLLIAAAAMAANKINKKGEIA